MFRIIAVILFCLALLIFGGAVAKSANAYPGYCTNDVPYPRTGLDVCTSYGQECPRVVCAYQPGTPGRFDVNGDYQPRYGN